MEKIELTLDAVTPVFIAGANQRNIENEGLRAPSLKGLLRWWFRAIMGGMLPLKDLKKLENDVFGSTNQKSHVRILSFSNALPSQIQEDDLFQNELSYLWFSIKMQKRNYQRLQYYPPGRKFKVILNSDEYEHLKIALGCLWALIYLGGIGARMRRGSGVLKVSESLNHTPYLFTFTGRTVYEARKFIEENLKSIFKDFKEYINEKYTPQSNLNFPVLLKNCAKISLSEKSFDSWDKPLKEVCRVYKELRIIKPVEQRWMWGLPIKSKRKTKLEEERYASPLFIGVMDLNGKYAARIVKFYTSLHQKFSKEKEVLRNELNNLDERLSKELGEVKVEIPELR